MVGIQFLATALSISLVVCTGLLVGTLSITKGNEVLDDTRSSSITDIEAVAGKYLTSVTDGINSKILNTFERSESILNGASRLIKSVTPEDAQARTASNNFIDNTLRSYMRQGVESNLDYGITQFGWRWGNRTGMQWHFVFDKSQVIQESPTELAWAVFESQDVRPGASTANRDFPGYHVVGSSDKQGKMMDLDAPCFALGTVVNGSTIPDRSKGEMMGRCIFPETFLWSVPFPGTLSEQLAWSNIQIEDAPSVESELIYTTAPRGFFATVQIEVKVVIEHPDYINPYALLTEHRHRIGFLTVILEGAVFGDILAQAITPANSILYCIGNEPLTKERSLMMATTYGRLSDWVDTPRGGGFSYPFRVPLAITNHSYTAEDPHTPSTIAYHGRYINDMFAEDFHTASQLTKGKFLVWNSPDTNTEYWYTVSHITFKESLNWYVPMLVPRASIMAGIDASIADGNVKQRDALVVTIVVTLCVATLLMVLSVVMTNLILAPLNVLGGEMESVATMHLDDVDTARDLSKLSEVQSMQKSFRQMVQNLIEYKQYMPASVLLSDDESGEEDDLRSQAVSSTGGDKSSRKQLTQTGSQNTAVSVSRKVAAAAAVNKLTDTSLKRKVITVVSYNLRKWLPVCSAVGDKAVSVLYEEVLSSIITTLLAYKGVTDTFAGDHILVAHNAFTNQPTHKASAISAAMRAKTAVSAIILPAAAKKVMEELSLSFAAASGESTIGQLGCKGMKKVTITAALVPWVTKLEEYNNNRGYRGTIDKSLAKDCQGKFLFRQTDVISYAKLLKKAGTSKPTGVFEVMAEVDADEDEWMYQIDEAEASNPYVAWNKAFDDVHNDPKASSEVAKNFPDKDVTDAEKERCADLFQNFQVLSFDYTR